MKQTNTEPTWKAFEDLVILMLESRGFVVRRHFPRGDAGFDLAAQLGRERWAVEVKYYRTARPQPTLIETAAGRVLVNGVASQASKAMLVVSCFLPPALRLALEEKFSITFVDRADLRNWAADNPTYGDQLDALLETDPSQAQESAGERDDPLDRSKPLPSTAPPPREARGTALCAELQKVKLGKDAWSSYEDVCARMLRYLFPNDLQGWHKQKRTDDGLSRYDFVCRVRPTTEFWKFLIDHLNSRYILFEFKNYRGKIKQGQILTTEKYLLDRGLRRAAIVMTRRGAEKNAIRMAQGAMREHGKLMLILGDHDLVRMLHMKERGEDPTDWLFELTDDFLLTLPR